VTINLNHVARVCLEEDFVPRHDWAAFVTLLMNCQLLPSPTIMPSRLDTDTLHIDYLSSMGFEEYCIT